jgi:two-component sensor histidine kinase
MNLNQALHFFLIFLCSGYLAVNAQQKDYTKTIEDIIPVTSEEDFNKTVSLFNTLTVEGNFNSILWDESFLVLFEQASNWAEKNSSTSNYLQSQYMLLMYYDNHLQNEEVIQIAEQLLEYPEFLETKNSAFAYQALYNSYERLGFFRQQIEILDQLIFLNKKYNYPVRPKTYENYYDLGKIYYNLEQYRLARLNFKKQGIIFENSQDYIRSASMLNNIALTFRLEKQNDSALYYHRIAIEKLKQQKNKDPFFSTDYQQHFENVIKSNIAYLKSRAGNFVGAEEIYKAELASSKLVKEPRITREAYYKLANLYFSKEDYALAKIYIDSTICSEKQYPSLQTKADIKLLQAKLLFKEQDINKGIEVLDEAFSINDSLNQVKNERVYSEATAKYNFEQTQNRLDRNIEILQQKEKTNLILLVLIASAIVAISIILFLFYKIKKSKQLIVFQKAELAKGLSEKQHLLDEMHHRTKNNLQIVGGILELQSQKNIPPEAYTLLKESQHYLESISLIHKMLYEQGNFEDVNLQTYLENLSELIIGNYPRKNIHLNISCQNVDLPVNLITSLGLILAELFTNSLKHAFTDEGSISIEHHFAHHEHHLIYQDNGHGFDEKFLKEKEGTGMKLIQSLSEDLEGEIRFYNENGFCFELKFKHTADEK